MPYGRTLSIDQSIYGSTNLYMNFRISVDVVVWDATLIINGIIPYLAAARRRRLSPPRITITYRHHQWAIVRIGRQQRWAIAILIAMAMLMGNSDGPPYLYAVELPYTLLINGPSISQWTIYLQMVQSMMNILFHLRMDWIDFITYRIFTPRP